MPLREEYGANDLMLEMFAAWREPSLQQKNTGTVTPDTVSSDRTKS